MNWTFIWKKVTDLNVQEEETNSLYCQDKFGGRNSAAITAWKVAKYGVISGPYFPAFGLNTERYEVSLHIQSECRKTDQKWLRIWTLFTQWMFDKLEERINEFMKSSNGTKISYQPYNKDQNSIFILATVTPLIQRENLQLIDFS